MEPIEDIAAFMKQNGLVLVTAESCTAGLIAARLADVPGAGALLDCAYVVYSCEAKEQCLGVKRETIERFNLTSEEVAREMAEGALEKSAANLAISNTGVAEAVDDETPPGTQCFAWAFRTGQNDDGSAIFSETHRFSGGRNEVRDAGAHYALMRVPYYFARLHESS
ncbi:CinA family protein [Aromatoleum aromaticum]|nr:CinA family protein [Aromatoleum aromaticum]NMG55143.1 nicotinamide-nucleotide amidohydrolase family protein [Aromatoleum aromaticum]